MTAERADAPLNRQEIIGRLESLAEHTNPSRLDLNQAAMWRKACREGAALLSEIAPSCKIGGCYLIDKNAAPQEPRNTMGTASTGQPAESASVSCVVVPKEFLSDLVKLYECRIHWGKALEQLRAYAELPPSERNGE